MDARASFTVPTHTWKGLVAGAAAGLVASWAMEQFQRRFSRAAGDHADAAQRASERSRAWDARTQDQVSGQAEPATERAVESAVMVTGHDLPAPDARASAAQALHYAFGAQAGRYSAELEVSDARSLRSGRSGTSMSVAITIRPRSKRTASSRTHDIHHAGSAPGRRAFIG